MKCPSLSHLTNVGLKSHGFVHFYLLCAELLVESSVVVAWWSYIVLVYVYCGRLLLLCQF
jgi:hypothetical protein